MKKKIEPKEYNGYLYVKYRDNGKLVQINFGKADARLSWKMAEDYLKTVNRNKNIKLNQPTLTLFEAMDLFVQKNEGIANLATIVTTCNHLKKYFKKNTRLSDIEQKDIDTFCRKLLEDTTIATVRTYLRGAKSMFRFFFDNKWIYQNFFSPHNLDGKVTEAIREYEKTLPSLKDRYADEPKNV